MPKKNDVLLVHAAGNSSMDNDKGKNFPNNQFKKRGLFRKKQAKNWLEIGAISWQNDENLVAPFSNYGDDQVDIFAPGVSINSTIPNDLYKPQDGTSMAAPVVSGVAAILRSHFPDLSALQVKGIIIESANPIQQKVIKPGSDDKVLLEDLSLSGGTVNAVKAFELAMKTKGKNKKKKKFKHYSYRMQKEKEILEKQKKVRT